MKNKIIAKKDDFRKGKTVKTKKEYGMKKTGVIAAIILCLALCFAVSACGRQNLTTPANIVMNEENLLSWSPNENARTYSVRVVNAESGEEKIYTTKKASYSLSKLEEGDYDISVKAIGDGKSHKDSDWSEVINFHKDYETGCVYTLVKNNTEYEITRVGSASGTVEISGEYRKKPVTGIASAAFKGSGRIEAVNIADSVTYIGASAFYNCVKLVSVNMPDTVAYIGESAFQNCRALTSVHISSKITKLENSVFSYCRSLESVKIPDSVTEIGSSAFSDCTALKSVEIPDSVKTLGEYSFSGDKSLVSVKIGKSVESIGKLAFYDNALLNEIVFSDGGNLKKLEESAFQQCASLNKIVLPKGLEDIGAYCFFRSENLSDISIPATVNHVGGYAFHNTKSFNDAVTAGESFIYADKWLVYCKEDTRNTVTDLETASFRAGTAGIADSVFAEAKELQTVKTPSSLRHIGEYAFAQCEKLWKIQTLAGSSGSVESIGKYAFFFCKNLTQPLFADGLKKIGDYAFYGCEKLDNPANTDYKLIPDSVTSIGMYAFNQTKLWKKSTANGVVYAGKWVVGYNGIKSSNIALEKGTVGIADYAFYKCSAITSVQGLSGAKHVGKGAFYGCINLAAVTLNSNLTVIEDYTFYECYKLYQVILPSWLEKIGRSAFYKCVAMEELNAENTTVAYIDDYAFFGCSGLKTITFGEELTEIGNYAFYGNSELIGISFPASLKKIGGKAFYKCVSVENINFGGTEEIGESAFSYCESLTEINAPSTLKTIGEKAFYKCPEVKKITLAEGVESIGNYAFCDMNKVTGIILPDSLEEIGNYAFKGMKGVKSIVIKKSVKKIGAHAFYGLNEATFYTDANGIMPEWNTRFNSSYRPIVWNCTLSEDGVYVTKTKIANNGITNAHAINGIVAPERNGYEFCGWASESGSDEISFTASEILSVPEGTVLYAVWKKS